MRQLIMIRSADDSDDVEAVEKELVEIAQIYVGTEHYLFSFSGVDGIERILVFSGAGFHLYENNLVVFLGDDVNFHIAESVIPFAEGISAGQEPVGGYRFSQGAPLSVGGALTYLVIGFDHRVTLP